MKNALLINLFIFAFLSNYHDADAVTLPKLISDGMVMQRQVPFKLWGDADPGEKVEVSFRKKKYSAIAGSDGKWAITLPEQKPGGPFDMKVNDITIKDVLVGDVWICSGQSNMELPVSRVTDMFAEEIARENNNPSIRQFKVSIGYDFHNVHDDVDKGEWRSLSESDVMNFSAFGYFYARKMFEATGVPQAIINSSVGGSPVQAWMSDKSLTGFPHYISERDICRNDDYVAEVRSSDNKRFGLWMQVLNANDPGVGRWMEYGLDRSSWSRVDMFSPEWGADNGLPVNGSHWFSKSIDIPESMASADAVLRMGCIVDADSVFINGHFVGSVGYQYPPRKYNVPVGVIRAGRNEVTVRLISNGGYPHFVKDKPYKLQLGGDEITLQGEWLYKQGARMPQAPSQTFFQYKPTGLYNAMMAPLNNFRAAGIIWYQGESNVDRFAEYESLLTTMISDWRLNRNAPDEPFYIVQLPNFLEPNGCFQQGGWAQLREQQRRVAQNMPGVEIAVTIDLGEWNDIHPLDKKSVANRVALLAMKDKGREIVSHGPVCESMRVSGERAEILFDSECGELLQNMKLEGFSVAGTDGVWHKAYARTIGNKVEVWSEHVASPVSVAYAWANNPQGANLINTSGLPAAPFITRSK